MNVYVETNFILELANDEALPDWMITHEITFSEKDQQNNMSACNKL